MSFFLISVSSTHWISARFPHQEDLKKKKEKSIREISSFSLSVIYMDKVKVVSRDSSSTRKNSSLTGTLFRTWAPANAVRKKRNNNRGPEMDIINHFCVHTPNFVVNGHCCNLLVPQICSGVKEESSIILGLWSLLSPSCFVILFYLSLFFFCIPHFVFDLRRSNW